MKMVSGIVKWKMGRVNFGGEPFIPGSPCTEEVS